MPERPSFNPNQTKPNKRIPPFRQLTNMSSDPTGNNTVPDQVVNLISSDDDDQQAQTSSKRPRTTTQVNVDSPLNIVEDDDELEVISCVRAKPKHSHHSHSQSQSQSQSHVPTTGGHVNTNKLSLTNQQHSSNNATNERQTSNSNNKRSGANRKDKVNNNNINNNNNNNNSSNSNNGDDQLEVVSESQGVIPLKHYPHFRFDCSKIDFKKQRAYRKKQFCEKCYCYVCDVEANKCAQWHDHYKATNTVMVWKNMRKARLDDRRKLAVDPSTRGTELARITVPVVVHNLVSDSESDQDATNSDLMERTQWYTEKNDVNPAASQSLTSINTNASTSVDIMTPLIAAEESFTTGNLQHILQRSHDRLSPGTGQVDLPADDEQD